MEKFIRDYPATGVVLISGLFCFLGCVLSVTGWLILNKADGIEKALIMSETRANKNYLELKKQQIEDRKEARQTGKDHASLMQSHSDLLRDHGWRITNLENKYD